jgi:hypothetical protein
MGYHTIFDGSQLPFRWWTQLLVSVCAILFLIVGFGAKRCCKKKVYRSTATFLQIAGGIGVFFALATCSYLYSRYRYAERVKRALATHSYSVREGQVEWVNGLWYADGVHTIFGLSDLQFAPADSGTLYEKGFLRPGDQARITCTSNQPIDAREAPCWKGEIIKVEVK